MGSIDEPGVGGEADEANGKLEVKMMQYGRTVIVD
jgi:hypothetical protein